MKRRTGAAIVSFESFDALHDEGREMVRSGFALAKERAERGDWFAAFCFLWMSFNGWTSCVTGGSFDKQMINALRDNEALQHEFSDLMKRSEVFRNDIRMFSSKWPVKKVAPTNIRGEPPEPQGWSADQEARWEQLVSAIYRVRCNLFHGNKGTYVVSPESSLERPRYR